MINSNSTAQEIVQFAETITAHQLSRFGADKSAMSALFNLIAPCQWLQDEGWEEYKILLLPRIAWLAGKSSGKASNWLRDFHNMQKSFLCKLSREQYRTFAEAVKAYYYFTCPTAN